MVDYALSDWIAERRRKGFTDNQIKSYLLGYGYNEQAVDQAMAFMKAQGQKSMKMGPPPSAGGYRIGDNHWDTMAIATLLALFFFPLLALPLGIISLRHIRHNPHLKGKAAAVIGIVFGSISLLFLIIFVGLFVFGFWSSFKSVGVS